MFSSNTLPPPTSFGHEHRPLRLTSESGRSHPKGGCHFQPVQGQSRRCLCQSFQHDRSAPGNLCDCGHSACYHSQTNNERMISPDRIVNALAEKLKKLEDAMVKEREARDSLIARERQAWEREIRVLREALAPFYHNEEEMTLRLVKIENKLDATHDMHVHLKQKLSSMDRVSFPLAQTSENGEGLRSKKRKASVAQGNHGLTSPDLNDELTNSDSTSMSQRSSKSISPMDDHLPQSRHSTHNSSTGGMLARRLSSKIDSGQGPLQHNHNPQLPSPEDEPRSSGFLSIDLTERIRRHNPSPPSRIKQDSPILPYISRGLPSPPQTRPSNPVTGMLPVSELLSNVGCRPANGPDIRSLKKRKQQNGIMALDVLANVTTASPLAH